MSKVCILHKNIQNKWTHWHMIEIQSSKDKMIIRELGKGCGNAEWAEDDSWLTAWCWITNRCALPWGTLILPLSAFLGFYSNLCRVQDAVFPFIHLVDLLMSLLSWCLCSHSGETFLGCSYWHPLETQHHSKRPNALALTTFLSHVPQCSLSFRCGSFVDASIPTGLHNSAFWLATVFSNALPLL